MITPEEKKEMLTIFRKHYDNLKMRCDIDNATLMLVILPAMQEYKLNKPAVINQVCDKCGDTGNMGNPTLSEPDGQRCDCVKQTCL